MLSWAFLDVHGELVSIGAILVPKYGMPKVPKSARIYFPLSLPSAVGWLCIDHTHPAFEGQGTLNARG